MGREGEGKRVELKRMSGYLLHWNKRVTPNKVSQHGADDNRYHTPVQLMTRD